MFFFSSPRPAPGRLIPNIEMGGTGVGAAGRMVYSLEYDSRYFLPGMDPYRAEQKIIRQVSTISGWGVAGFVSWEGGEEREGWGRGIGGWAFGGVGNGGIWKTHSFVRLGGATAYRIC